MPKAEENITNATVETTENIKELTEKSNNEEQKAEENNFNFGQEFSNIQDLLKGTSLINEEKPEEKKEEEKEK